MNYEEEIFELRQLVIDAYQLHDRMFRLGANLPALREWAERFHDISDLPEGEIGPTAQSEIDRLQGESERLKSQWQPMETAPMDGTEILIYSEISGINVMLFMDGRFREKVSFCSLRSPPTHWMPLPIPPNT